MRPDDVSLLGWGVQRSEEAYSLRDDGVTLSLDYIGDTVANPVGGIREKGANSFWVDAGVDLNGIRSWRHAVAWRWQQCHALTAGDGRGGRCCEREWARQWPRA